jgi:hypothetical protein
MRTTLNLDDDGLETAKRLAARDRKPSMARTVTPDIVQEILDETP